MIVGSTPRHSGVAGGVTGVIVLTGVVVGASVPDSEPVHWASGAVVSGSSWGTSWLDSQATSSATAAPAPSVRSMRRYPLGNRGLAIVLGLMFLVSWMLQAVFQVAIEDESWNSFWSSTLENWQSEFLQLFTFLTLTSVLVYKGSPESRDSDDELNEKVDEILRRLDKQ
jgi:hypothetical protein